MLNNVVLRVLETERRAHAEDETERSIGSKDPFVLIVTARNCATWIVREMLARMTQNMVKIWRVCVSEWIASEYVDRKYGRLTMPSLIFLRLTFHQYSLGQEWFETQKTFETVHTREIRREWTRGSIFIYISVNVRVVSCGSRREVSVNIINSIIIIVSKAKFAQKLTWYIV